MKNVNKFEFFIDESYLDSNHAPLYHFTNNFYLESILEENELTVGWFENPFFNSKLKIISFSRNKNLNLEHYKDDINVIICLDKDKLINKGYRFYPYDFFIQNRKETLPKSNIKRKEPFEFEEATLKNISNLDNFLLYIDFIGDSLYDSYKSVNILKKKNIRIYENGSRVF